MLRRAILPKYTIIIPILQITSLEHRGLLRILLSVPQLISCRNGIDTQPLQSGFEHCPLPTCSVAFPELVNLRHLEYDLFHKSGYKLGTGD